MSAWLKNFIALPRLACLPEMPGGKDLYFLIDTVLQPNTAQQLYGLGGQMEARSLFLGTDFAGLVECSPLWIKVEAGSEAADLAGTLCVSERAGIALEITTTEEAAFKHAQCLLRMRSSSAGDVLSRFYDPLFWSALALTTSSSLQANLFGPWLRVWTPAEPDSEAAWLSWENSADSTAIPTAPHPLVVSAEAIATHDDLRWYYWLCSQCEAMPYRLSYGSLSLVIDNLRLLVSHGIQDGRHLQRLLSLLDRMPLPQQGEVMTVLNSSLPSYQKVQRLEGMTI
ncbi:conserved hypothetical protein [Pseudomonas sp. 8Z]|uniref:DUF4123 domain-containing protein n=1 Tax=Pseudomonas sp. 8Z TaxID=2653166 RepID=UPI0012F00396|nr:DUF4123 domain-containing protein [Pseudomonas sp. 8Z]VXC97237.1 conserved hypothetical protein [Pseudomonas sp. 8Z]